MYVFSLSHSITLHYIKVSRSTAMWIVDLSRQEGRGWPVAGRGWLMVTWSVQRRGGNDGGGCNEFLKCFQYCLETKTHNVSTSQFIVIFVE